MKIALSKNRFEHAIWYSAFYVALYGIIQPSGPTPFADKIAEIVIDADRTNVQTKPSSKLVIRFVYQSLCCSAFVKIIFESSMQSKRKTKMSFELNTVHTRVEKTVHTVRRW